MGSGYPQFMSLKRSLPPISPSPNERIYQYHHALRIPHCKYLTTFSIALPLQKPYAVPHDTKSIHDTVVTVHDKTLLQDVISLDRETG